MNYWIYENWTVRKGGQAKVHKEDCQCCNYGNGRRGKGKRTKNGMWHGPFPNLKKARQAKLKKVRKAPAQCSFCLGKTPYK